MDEPTDIELLQRYRRDRYDLLNFILSSGIMDVIVPPGALSLDDVDLDQVNVEFVIQCARNKQTLDLQEAIRTQYLKKNLLQKVNLVSRDIYFLTTDPTLSGPPPVRIPPLGKSDTSSPSGVSHNPLQSIYTSNNIMREDIKHCIDMEENLHEETVIRHKDFSFHDFNSLLPSFVSGLSDDDLNETAYEVLLASVGGAVGLISPSKAGREELQLNLSRKLTYEDTDKYLWRSQKSPGLAGLLDTMRVQMGISKSRDRRIKRALSRAASLRAGKRMDCLLIPLEFLFVVSWQDFQSSKEFNIWRKRQLFLLEEGLVNHPAVHLEDIDRIGAEMRLLIKKVEEFQDCTSPADKYAESVRALHSFAITLAERPREGEQIGESCHWADGYHLNVCIYEQLLRSIFDINNEVEMVEEVEEILELIKSTWRMLGISQTLHDLCFSWVLFKQFVLTGEEKILIHAAKQLKKVATFSQQSPHERAYMQSLQCTMKNDVFKRLTYAQALLIPMKLWVDKRLEDYHKHFSKSLEGMDAHLTIAMNAHKHLAEEATEYQNIKSCSLDEIVPFSKQVKDYISSSIKLEYERILDRVTKRSDSEVKRLLLLADDIKEMMENEIALFAPVLSCWNVDCLGVSASLVHSLYHKELCPFIDSTRDLTDEFSLVIQAASRLESSLRSLVLSNHRDESNQIDHLPSYKLDMVSGKFVLPWIDSEMKRICSIVQQSILEEDWSAISNEQEQSKSIVCIFNVFQETICQFFNLGLPIGLQEIRSLVLGLDKALKLYCSCILSQIGTIEDLMPPVPPLTRHGKEAVISFSKKKVTEEKPSDGDCHVDTTLLSTVKLCIRLNSLHYMLCQVDALEANIKEQLLKRWPDNHTCFLPLRHLKCMERKGRVVSQTLREFSLGFADTKKVSGLTLDKVCEFTGTKIIFFDMRETFINGLYKGSVLSSRIHKVICGLDSVLEELLANIVEPLREQLVMGLLKASLSGLLRVLLDGGPSRVFSRSDGDLLSEDLQMLKDFFIADGDGLPCALVEGASQLVSEVVDLYKSEITNVIQNFKNTPAHVWGQHTPQQIMHKASRDLSILLRVLCHRSENEASKFLKKHHRFLKASN